MCGFSEFYKYFPRPPLRSLHWEVQRYCEDSFIDCIKYLHKTIQQTTVKRIDDTAFLIKEQNWNFIKNAQQIKQVDDECKKLQKIDDLLANPFDGQCDNLK